MDGNVIENTVRRPIWVTLAHLQGFVAPALFWAVAIGGGLFHPDYSHVSQAVSALTGAGAPYKMFLDPVLVVTELLTIVFGIGLLWAVSR